MIVTYDSIGPSRNLTRVSCPFCKRFLVEADEVSGTCLTCGSVAWNYSDEAPKASPDSGNAREDKKKKSRCKLCHGSGYDIKGKPCRK